MNNVVTAGEPVATAKKVLIMLHGRGATAEDILAIADYLDTDGFAFLAPQAKGNTWYPLSFLAKPEDNEPYLTASLNIISNIVSELAEQGVTKERIYFLGFSQGACLVSEYVARNAAKYGGVVIFTGGVIGDKIYSENYSGNFNDTPIFIGSSNPDFHVPVERINDTVALLKQMGANVTVKIYDNMPHTISQDEIELANTLIFKQG